MCGDSKPAGVCSGLTTFAQAQAFCAAGGGRLCTSEELTADVPAATGCQYDKTRVWSSTSCDAGAHLTQAGASRMLSAYPRSCTSDSQTAFVRCCADVDTTPASACTHTPDAANCENEEFCDPVEGCLGVDAVEPYPRSCKAIRGLITDLVSGVYRIDVDGPGPLEPFDALCDMSSGGGGWTLIAYNDQPTVFTNFNLGWDDYKAGFGDLPGGQFGWIGNDRMAVLTAGGVDLEVRHDEDISSYADFHVRDESQNYLMTVSGSAFGGSFSGGHNNRPFSTFDRDNDVSSQNCAADYSAGWWYGDCHVASIASDGPAVFWEIIGGVTFFVDDDIGMWVR